MRIVPSKLWIWGAACGANSYYVLAYCHWVPPNQTSSSFFSFNYSYSLKMIWELWNIQIVEGKKPPLMDYKAVIMYKLKGKSSSSFLRSLKVIFIYEIVLIFEVIFIFLFCSHKPKCAIAHPSSKNPFRYRGCQCQICQRQVFQSIRNWHSCPSRRMILSRQYWEILQQHQG